MSGRTVDEILAATLSRLDVLEVEAARLVVLAKANDDPVLGASTSLVYQTVTALAEDFKELQKRTASASK